MGGDQNLFGLFGRAVYVGDDGQGSPVYLFQQTGPSIVDIDSEPSLGHAAFRTFG